MEPNAGKRIFHPFNCRQLSAEIQKGGGGGVTYTGGRVHRMVFLQIFQKQMGPFEPLSPP